MESKKYSEEKTKKGTLRKWFVPLVVAVVLVILVVAARTLVGNVDIVELLKKIHGG